MREQQRTGVNVRVGAVNVGVRVVAEHVLVQPHKVPAQQTRQIQDTHSKGVVSKRRAPNPTATPQPPNSSPVRSFAPATYEEPFKKSWLMPSTRHTSGECVIEKCELSCIGVRPICKRTVPPPRPRPHPRPFSVRTMDWVDTLAADHATHQRAAQANHERHHGPEGKVGLGHHQLAVPRRRQRAKDERVADPHVRCVLHTWKTHLKTTWSRVSGCRAIRHGLGDQARRVGDRARLGRSGTAWAIRHGLGDQARRVGWGGYLGVDLVGLEVVGHALDRGAARSGCGGRWMPVR